MFSALKFWKLSNRFVKAILCSYVELLCYQLFNFRRLFCSQTLVIVDYEQRAHSHGPISHPWAKQPYLIDLNYNWKCAPLFMLSSDGFRSLGMTVEKQLVLSCLIFWNFVKADGKLPSFILDAKEQSSFLVVLWFLPISFTRICGIYFPCSGVHSPSTCAERNGLMNHDTEIDVDCFELTVHLFNLGRRERRKAKDHCHRSDKGTVW